MTLDLVNHQIMHLFGGIQAQKNSSLESLEGFQKKIFKGMERAQQSHKKVYNAINMVKQGLAELSDNYLGLCRENKHSGHLINKLIQEIDELMQKLAEESLSLSNKMETKANNYIPNFKKLKDKYTECADNLQHYRQKVSLLRRNVEKQSLTKIKQDEHLRFQRNKDKLRSAEIEHDEVLVKITKRFVEFNNEGLKDIYFDLLTVFSTIGSQMIGTTSKISKHLYDSFSTKEILLAREVRSKKKSHQVPSLITQKHKQANPDVAQVSREKFGDNKAKWLEYLIQQKQLSNYLKTLMDRQMARIQTPLKIGDAFSKRDIQNRQLPATNEFEAFNNQYRCPERNYKLDRVESQEELDADDGLISVEELSVMSPTISVDDNQVVDELTPEVQRYPPKRSAITEEERKNNIERFNLMCESNKNRLVQNKTGQQKQPHSFKNSLLLNRNNKPVQKLQKTVNAGDFFNILDATDKKQTQRIAKQQQKLNTINQHQFQFNFMAQNPIQNSSNLNKDRSKNCESHPPTQSRKSEDEKSGHIDFFSQPFTIKKATEASRGYIQSYGSKTFELSPTNNGRKPSEDPGSCDLLDI